MCSAVCSLLLLNTIHLILHHFTVFLGISSAASDSVVLLLTADAFTAW